MMLSCVGMFVWNQGKGIQTTYWLMGRKGTPWFDDYIAWTGQQQQEQKLHVKRYSSYSRSI